MTTPGIVLAIVGLHLNRLLARSISVASRAIAPRCVPERPLDQRRVDLVRQLALRQFGERPGKGGLGRNLRASLQPRMRRSDLLTARRSIRALVVGTRRTALATKARARARRSSGGRPGPLGGSGAKASRPITSSVVMR